MLYCLGKISMRPLIRSTAFISALIALLLPVLAGAADSSELHITPQGTLSATNLPLRQSHRERRQYPRALARDRVEDYRGESAERQLISALLCTSQCYLRCDDRRRPCARPHHQRRPLDRIRRPRGGGQDTLRIRHL